MVSVCVIGLKRRNNWNNCLNAFSYTYVEMIWTYIFVNEAGPVMLWKLKFYLVRRSMQYDDMLSRLTLVIAWLRAYQLCDIIKAFFFGLKTSVSFSLFHYFFISFFLFFFLSLFIYLFLYLFIYLIIYLFIYLFIY